MSELNILRLSNSAPDAISSAKTGHGVNKTESNIFRLPNPMLGEKAFSGIENSSEEAMTLGGTANKTALSLIVLFIAALFSWNFVISGSSPGWLISLGSIGGFIVAMVTVFKKDWAPYTTLVYASLEGVALGAISVAFEHRYPGIVSQAVFLTFGILAAMLLAYRLRIIKPSEKVELGVIAATGGIAILYLISFIFGRFGVTIPMIHSGSTVGLLFSLFVVIIASLNLVLDFGLIEAGVKQRAPKYMEWYAAFALLVTLVWIYLELLRLLGSSEE